MLHEGADSQWERALSFLDATAELNYMSQIVFMLFEDPSKVSARLITLKGWGGGGVVISDSGGKILDHVSGKMRKLVRS